MQNVLDDLDDLFRPRELPREGCVPQTHGIDSRRKDRLRWPELAERNVALFDVGLAPAPRGKRVGDRRQIEDDRTLEGSRTFSDSRFFLN